ncbi:hypothetical protein C2E25_09020 [Geothermobacter hydrogeniphilus]|uniref:Uncharacterized protein n=1 Tax=Geothermobacter hydrogeniphilus TaxID=1969733 RepID=A0A1X0YB46_9BACT|nr:hypothetical protein [Geothermobacter hydrogeniphilus]ORJ62450.1 hypothetical protein B5V00_03965 [Geothermobacter hydrogeniphilus]PNU20047.1 hypothetical protein C2E25_09020 [Geothermobacter hydrogeniphilus]
MLLALFFLALFLYLVFIVDWDVVRPAFAKGGWVVLGIYCLIAVGYYAAKANHVVAAAGISHHG